jgi:hypothetical protein
MNGNQSRSRALVISKEVQPLSIAHALPRARGARMQVLTIGGDVAAGAALLGIAVVIGLMTASHYGLTVDEFNTDDYGPKALAWYTSFGADRSHFETVEEYLWYYGPWHQILTAIAQSLLPADPITVRHAMTFLAGIAGLAALVPIARLSVGRWVGPVAIALSLMTGYLYGGLFFTPIDVPFLAAITWATWAVLLMARGTAPTWPATVAAGLLTGLAMATRTGGIITHAYLVAAMALVALDAVISQRHAAAPLLLRIAGRTLAAIAIAWMTAIALWPWLQIGNPFEQFATAYWHFTNMPMEFQFQSWGRELTTNALPWYYIPSQFLVRLPEGFLILLACGASAATYVTFKFARATSIRLTRQGLAGLAVPARVLARSRGTLVVIAAVVVPVGFMMVTGATHYDGIRHILFVVPMLALLAGALLVRLLSVLRSRPMIAFAVVAAAVVHFGATVWTLGRLHPLEYAAMNSLAGGVKGADGRFELDYWGTSVGEALRLLERRIDGDARFAARAPRVMVCMTHRDWAAGKLFRRAWIVETDLAKADFIIDTERWRCGQDVSATLLDEVTRLGVSFARIYEQNRRRPN